VPSGRGTAHADDSSRQRPARRAIRFDDQPRVVREASRSRDPHSRAPRARLSDQLIRFGRPLPAHRTRSPEHSDRSDRCGNRVRLSRPSAIVRGYDRIGRHWARPGYTHRRDEAIAGRETCWRVPLGEWAASAVALVPTGDFVDEGIRDQARRAPGRLGCRSRVVVLE